MSQTHIKTIQGWLPDVRKENTVSMSLKALFGHLATIEDPDELQQVVKTIAKGEYATIAQAVGENTPYSAAGSTGAAKSGT